MITRKRLTVYYSGRVQGVGFRYTVREVACGYEVTGHVRNLPDGRVELVAEGDENELKAFLDGVRDAGLAGHIRHEETHWQPPTGEFGGFEIRF
jgi:acylphosphatase